jgi:hypothetical protein
VEVRLGEQWNTVIGTIELVYRWGARRFAVNDCDMRPSLRSCSIAFRTVRLSGSPCPSPVGSRSQGVGQRG